MPFRCVVYGCSNVPNSEKNISLHSIPFESDSRPEAKKRRRQWIQFVSAKRAKWAPSKTSKVCSIHFKPDDFTVRFTSVNDGLSNLSFVQKLKTDDIGIAAIPSIQVPFQNEATTTTAAARRNHRQVTYSG